jgi:hypothetical protein
MARILPNRMLIAPCRSAYDAHTSAKTASIGGQPLRDTELLAWCGEVIRSVLADLPGAGS